MVTDRCCVRTVYRIGTCVYVFAAPSIFYQRFHGHVYTISAYLSCMYIHMYICIYVSTLCVCALCTPTHSPHMHSVVFNLGRLKSIFNGTLGDCLRSNFLRDPLLDICCIDCVWVVCPHPVFVGVWWEDASLTLSCGKLV